MNKKRANAVNIKTEELTSKSKLTYEFPNMEVEALIEVVNNIENDEPLSKNTLLTLLDYIVTTCQFDQVFAIIESNSELLRLLEKRAEDYQMKKKQIIIVCKNTEGPISIIYIENKDHLSEDKVVTICQSISHSYVSRDIKQVLQQKFSEECIVEYNAKFICDLHVVLFLNTTICRMKKESSKYQHEIKNVLTLDVDINTYRKNMIQVLQEIYVKQSFENVLNTDLKGNKTFIKEFQTFLGDISETLNEISMCTEYNKIRNEEIERCSNDQSYVFNDERLNKAKEAFLNSKSINNLLKIYEEKLKDPNYNLAKDESDFRPIIELKYTKQINIIRRILAIVQKCKIQSVKDLAEDTLSRHLGIDYNKIRKMCSALNVLDAKEIDNMELNISAPISMENIQNHINNIPKISNHIESDEIVSTKEILKKIEFPNDNLQKEKLIANLKHNLQKIKEESVTWKSKTAKEIQEWAIKNKNQISSQNIVQAICVINRANEICTGGHQLRITQILAILAFLKGENVHQNKICEVQTGEGKTTIIAIIAAIKILSGIKSVDIITSNSVLAIEGVQANRLLFSILNMTVAENNTTSNENGSNRLCYKADITYGTITNFQFDYLRHNFEGLETRGERKFDFLILDEVDCMLIDNAAHIAKLSSPFPGMEYIKYVYIKIWKELYQAEDNVSNKLYISRCKMIERLKEEVNSGTKSLETADNELETFNKTNVDNTYEEIINHIKDSKPLNLDLIPSHLVDFCLRSLDKWIDNAMYAKYSCIENLNYVVKEENGEKVIIPVDNTNTGVTMKNTMWSKGLHQFLQLKHNLRLTSETLTSCAISTLGYIKHYENKIFGLTGTLGSKDEINLLATLYNVAFCKIPTYKEKKFTELKSSVIQDDLWSVTIVKSTIKQIKARRAVLIICNSIQDVLQLKEDFDILRDEEILDENFNVKTYQDESFSSVTHEIVHSGDIIIATNIAGRGADFKTDEYLEKKGGLHVCVTFCPDNKRVKEQAYFRTSRQGNNGTAQRIIRVSELVSIGLNKDSSLTDIDLTIQNLESLKTKKLLQHKVHELKIQDLLCQKYSQLIKELLESRKGEDGLLYLLKDLKEKWAFWIDAKCLHHMNFSNANVDTLFKEFETSSQNLLHHGQIFNSYYTIQLAEYFLQNNNYDSALKSVEKVLTLDKCFTLHSAYIKRFEIYVEKENAITSRFCRAISKVLVFGYFVDTEEPKTNLKLFLKSNLENASKALKIELEHIQLNILGPDETEFKKKDTKNSEHTKFQKILIQPADGEKNLLFTHLYSRYICLSHHELNISGLIKEIDEIENESLALHCRNSHFLQSLDPNKNNEKTMKDAITEVEISELARLGIETTYALRSVYDVHNATIIGAQAQIGSGLALLATGVVFPPYNLPLSQIAGTLLSEGIMDIVMELISQGNSQFVSASYIKNKSVSYGISLVTMGVSAILTCEKVLNASIKACKNLSEMLRRCQRIKTICEKLAQWIDNIQRWLKKIKYMKAIKYFSQIKNCRTLPFHKIYLPALTNIIKGSIKQVTVAVIMEKVVKAAISEFITAAFEEKIRGKVKNNINKDKNLCEKLITLKIGYIQERSSEVINGLNEGALCEIATDISVGVIRSYLYPIDNLIWDTTKCYIVVDNFLNGYTSELYKKICDKNDQKKNELQDVIQNLAVSVTNRIIAELNNTCEKYANLLVVKTLDKAIDIVGEEKKIISNNDDPWELLGLEPGATNEEIQNAYIVFISENRSDKKNSADLNLEIGKASIQFLLESNMVLSSTENNCVLDSTAALLEKRPEEISGATGFANAGIGASIDNAVCMLQKVGLEPSRDVIGSPDSNTEERITNFMRKNNSDKCIAFVKNKDDSLGHAPLIKMENGIANVYEVDGTKMSWTDYTSSNPNIEKVTFLTSKDFNLKLPKAQQYINKNRQKYTDFTPLGATVDSSFYGMKKKRVIETFYPGGIQLGGLKHEQVIHKFKTILNKKFNKAQDYGVPLQVKKDHKNPKLKTHEIHVDKISASQQQNMMNRQGVPVFGKDLHSKESDRMIGIIEVTYTNGCKEKILTLSGDTPIKSYQKVNIVNQTLTPGNLQDLTLSKIDGYTFHNVGKPTGLVKNLKTGQSTDVQYTQSCAAQKGIFVINNKMDRDSKLRVNNIRMTEVMWSPNTKTIHNPVPSCDKCDTVIPQAMNQKK